MTHALCFFPQMQPISPDSNQVLQIGDRWKSRDYRMWCRLGSVIYEALLNAIRIAHFSYLLVCFKGAPICELEQ